MSVGIDPPHYKCPSFSIKHHTAPACGLTKGPVNSLTRWTSTACFTRDVGEIDDALPDINVLTNIGDVLPYYACW